MPRLRLGARNIINKFALQLGERAEDHQGNLARSSQVDTQMHMMRRQGVHLKYLPWADLAAHTDTQTQGPTIVGLFLTHIQ